MQDKNHWACNFMYTLTIFFEGQYYLRLHLPNSCGGGPQQPKVHKTDHFP